MKKIFDVPKQKKVRVLINTDAKNEADDQFAIVHALLTPKFNVKTVMAAHFGKTKSQHSMEESYEEIKKVVSLMGIHGEVNISKGASEALIDENTPQESEGAKLIIEEAMCNDSSDLFAVFLGPLTDIASAYLMEPEIAGKVKVIWIGGGAYPDGENEFNLSNDINAANVVFKSDLEVWQVPRNVYSTMRVSIAELIHKVSPCGKIGKYLVDQLIDFNNKMADFGRWPLGESWSLGDSPVIGLMMDEHMYDYEEINAPSINQDMTYTANETNRKIRVYKKIDHRFILEDMFSKLYLYYGN